MNDVVGQVVDSIEEVSPLDAILNAYKAPEATFSIDMGTGEPLKFRAIISTDELAKLKQSARGFIQVERASPEKDEFSIYYNCSAETKAAAFLMGTTCLTEGMGVNEFLKLAGEAAFGFDFIYQAWGRKNTNAEAVAKKAAYEAAKKE